jgi:hypothetical protein
VCHSIYDNKKAGSALLISAAAVDGTIEQIELPIPGRDRR